MWFQSNLGLTSARRRIWKNFVDSELALLFSKMKPPRIGSIKQIETDRFRGNVIIETGVDDNHILDAMFADALHQHFRICDRWKPNHSSPRIVVNKRTLARGNDGAFGSVWD